MTEMISIYSDKDNLGTLFAHKADADQYMLDWLRDSLAYGGIPSDMPKLVEIKKRIGGQTFVFWLVAFSH